VCGKLRAMAAARGDDEMLLIARTDAYRVSRSAETTISRCRDYVAAGADALMVLDLGPDGIAPFREAFPRTPLCWIGGIAEPVSSRGELETAGFAIATYPFNTIGAVTEAIVAIWSGFADTGRPKSLGKPVPAVVAQALDVIGLERSLEIERQTTEAVVTETGARR
jgi:2-methylisocitrate lyase-like PEP mutase family enzyme